jgi:hypothetical protein
MVRASAMKSRRVRRSLYLNDRPTGAIVRTIQATTGVRLDLRLAKPPIRAKPPIIIAQIAGSGTAEARKDPAP